MHCLHMHCKWRCSLFLFSLSRYERGKKCEMEMKTDFSKILPTENGKVKWLMIWGIKAIDWESVSLCSSFSYTLGYFIKILKASQKHQFYFKILRVTIVLISSSFSSHLKVLYFQEIECEDKKNASNDKSQDNTHFIVTTVTNQMQETYT